MYLCYPRYLKCKKKFCPKKKPSQSESNENFAKVEESQENVQILEPIFRMPLKKSVNQVDTPRFSQKDEACSDIEEDPVREGEVVA